MSMMLDQEEEAEDAIDTNKKRQCCGLKKA